MKTNKEEMNKKNQNESRKNFKDYDTTNNEISNISTQKKNTNNRKRYHSLSLLETFILRYSDPINSISLSDDHLLFGSMMGRVIFYNIDRGQLFKLYDLEDENIMGCSLETIINKEKIHFVAIGDEKVVSIKEKDNNQDIETNTIFNYDHKEVHTDKCPNCFTLMDKDKLLLLNLNIPSAYNDPIIVNDCSFTLIKYDYEDKINDNIIEGNIKMSNYVVPFDFRDNKLLFLEHHPKNKRKICMYEFLDNKTEDNNTNKNDNKNGKIELAEKNPNFGHISFMKIMNKNTILMVRNYNSIEIYDISPKMFKKAEFRDANGEIIAIDFVEICNDNDNSNDDSNENISNFIESKQYNIIFLDEAQNIIELSYTSNKFDVNFKVNINEIKNIKDELKQKGLFDLDFPYYIKNSEEYVALTTDQACFLFQKE